LSPPEESLSQTRKNSYWVLINEKPYEGKAKTKANLKRKRKKESTPAAHGHLLLLHSLSSLFLFVLNEKSVFF
jgi:hypothetical protein